MEFSRSGLRGFGISTPEEAFAQIGPLWAYATGSWLSLRTPSSDTTRSRWLLDPRWGAIQQSTLAGAALPADRIRAGEAAGALRNLMPGLVGFLSGAAVPLGTNHIDETLDAIRSHVRDYGLMSQTSFEERVAKKRQPR